MKKCLFLLIISLQSISAFAHNNHAYRLYLLKQINFSQKISFLAPEKIQNTCTVNIPAYEIPKASVFCRLEDKLTRATGIWIKVGVK